MLPCTSRCWVHPCLLTWGGPLRLLLCSASFLPTFTTSSPSQEPQGSSEATHGLSRWVPRASHPVWFGAAGVFAGREASRGRRAGAGSAADTQLPLSSLFGKWRLCGTGIFCLWKCWLMLEPEAVPLCARSASFSSVVLGVQKWLVLVGSFHFLYLPSFWTRSSCSLADRRCTGIYC